LFVFDVSKKSISILTKKNEKRTLWSNSFFYEFYSFYGFLNFIVFMGFYSFIFLWGFYSFMFFIDLMFL